MNNLNSSISVVLIGFMLLLSISLTVELPQAGARTKSISDSHSSKQLVNQKVKCASDAICLAKAINILCMKNSLCYIGYNAPFLMTTPH
jgi:uncharacterized membrane protein